MENHNRKIALVGTGMVGMSFAYAALNQNLCDELVLIDINKTRAEGEAMDLNHGLAFAHSSMHIYAGTYADCHDAALCVLCAGVNQKPGETRLELLRRNEAVFRSIITPVVNGGFHGIFLVATNPVDVMTQITFELSRFPARQVVGSGTTLDTARLRYLLGEYFGVSPKNVHAYVMGEHGDSEFVPWSQALVATKSAAAICMDSGGRYSLSQMEALSAQVRGAAQQIISAKGATYYGIGMALVRCARAILEDENAVLTISARLQGEYGHSGLFIGVPCVLNHRGADRILELHLTREEQEKFDHSYQVLENARNEIHNKAAAFSQFEKK